MCWRLLATCSLLLALWLPGATGLPGLAVAATTVGTALSMDLEGAISPIQADQLETVLARARKIGALVVLVRLDTPGGSVEVMRRMVKAIRQSPVPVAIWVGPSGARAASAGVFLVAAAQVNAMAPQTTIGSASPVGLGGGDLNKTMDAKVRNDLESLVRSLATGTGRNAVWYQSAVAKADNLTAMEAVGKRVVDYLAVSLPDFLDQMGARGLKTATGVTHFTAAQVTVTPVEPGLRHKLLAWLLDPQVAYILLLVGVAGIFFELTTPGAILPGVLGGLCLLPALYALSVLPTNAAGLLLLLFGGALFLLEVHITSYGLLSLAGLAALFLGSVMLFRGNGVGGLPLSLITPTVIGVAAILAAAGWLLARAQRQKPRTGSEALIGQEALVRHWDNEAGKVLIRGEIWDAVFDPTLPAPLPAARLLPGDHVRVVAVRDMLLYVALPDDREP